METETSTTAHPSTPSAWPPRLGRMYLFTVLMFLSMGMPNFVLALLGSGQRPEDATRWVSMTLGYLLLVVFAVLAHRDYKVARAALAADSALRGRWLTENAWWIGFVGPVLVIVVWFAYATVLGEGWP